MDILVLIIYVAALACSLSLHEFSHAFTAHLLDDDTAERAGRLTLNPLKHVDPIGTILIPLIGYMTRLPLIGWAKPVPYNPYNLKWPRWGAAVVSLAGPASNIAAAIASLLLYKLSVDVLNLDQSNLLPNFLAVLALLNVSLAVFNLLPVPPLDGSGLFNAVFSAPQYANARRFLAQRGPMIILALILIDSFTQVSVLGSIFTFSERLVFGLMGETRALIQAYQVF